MLNNGKLIKNLFNYKSLNSFIRDYEQEGLTNPSNIFFMINGEKKNLFSGYVDYVFDSVSQTEEDLSIILYLIEQGGSFLDKVKDKNIFLFDKYIINALLVDQYNNKSFICKKRKIYKKMTDQVMNANIKIVDRQRIDEVLKEMINPWIGDKLFNIFGYLLFYRNILYSNQNSDSERIDFDCYIFDKINRELDKRELILSKNDHINILSLTYKTNCLFYNLSYKFFSDMASETKVDLVNRYKEFCLILLRKSSTFEENKLLEDHLNKTKNTFNLNQKKEIIVAFQKKENENNELLKKFMVSYEKDILSSTVGKKEKKRGSVL